VIERDGARGRLDRAAAQVRDHLEWLAARLTPGATPQVTIPPEPAAVGWQEPVRYRFQASARAGGRNYDPTIVDQAVAALTGTGWTVHIERSDDGQTAVTATRDDFRVQVRVQEGYGGVVYTGETPAIALYESDSVAPPEPVVTPQTVSDDAVLCYECAGLGWCPSCQGRGWTTTGPSGRQRCRECLGTKVCPICRGVGELVTAEMTAPDRAHYPHLPTATDKGHNR
jgi:hypothetical protein